MQYMYICNPEARPLSLPTQTPIYMYTPKSIILLVFERNNARLV